MIDIFQIETCHGASAGRYVLFDTGAPIHPGDYLGEVMAKDTCAGAPSGCTPSVKGISFDAQGHVVPGVVPVSISADGHYALLLDTSNGAFNLYLALTGY